MTPPDDAPVHRPRTVSPGNEAGRPPVIRPRTVGALGAPEPVAPVAQPEPAPTPPLESFTDLTWEPPTGQLPAVAVEEAIETAVELGEVHLDPDIWVVGPEGDEPPEDLDDLWTESILDEGRRRDRLASTGAAAEGTAAADEVERRILADAVAGTAPAWASATAPTTTDEVAVAPAEEPKAAPEVEAEVHAKVEDRTASTVDDGSGAGGGRRLLRANLVVASGTALSRLTGLVRTLLILYVLGDGLNDAFNNANNTPNMVYELILGGILTASLVPLFTDDLEKGDGRDGTSAIISVALVALLAVTVVGIVVGPLLILLFSTGSESVSRDSYVQVGVPLALLFAPQIFFYGLMAVWSAVLNARRRFLAAAWAPVLNNLIAIGALLYAGHLLDESGFASDEGLFAALDDRRIIWVLGFGATLGIATMALSLYPALRRSGFRLRFRVDLQHPAVRRAVRLSAWTLGYVIANQVAVIVIQILAVPASGDVSLYQTSFQFFQLPHALLAVSIMVTFEPLLGRADSRGDLRSYNDQLLLGFRLIALLIIPAAIGYIALPQGLESRTFEETGRMLTTAFDVTGVVAAFAIGLPGFSMYLYALRGFYAKKNTKIPFVINCIENGLNIVLAVAFVVWLDWDVTGLALAFALAYDVSAVIAVVALARRSPGFDVRGLVSSGVRLLLAAVIMGGFVYGVVSIMAPSSALMLVPTVAVGILVGVVTYFAAIFALQVPGVSELMARLPVLRRFA